MIQLFQNPNQHSEVQSGQFRRLSQSKLLNLTLILLALSLTVPSSKGAFSGQIILSDSQIGAQNVDYTFNLKFQQTIPSDGKIQIRFPRDYTESFSGVTCSALAHLSITGPLTCTYIPNVRLLTITTGFPSTFTEMSIKVSGVKNPPFAKTTGIFSVESFQKNGADFIPLESSSNSISVTPTPGTLTQEVLTLESQVVSEYSSLTTSLRTQNFIPKDGALEILFPKWNSFAPKTSLFESLVTTSTSPGIVPCKPIQGFPGASDLMCTFEHGVSTDLLIISFEGYLSGNVAPNSFLQIQIEGVRGPPSLTPLSGFSFRSTNKDGDNIDQSATTAQTSVKLEASLPSVSSPAAMQVTADDPSINRLTELTLRINNLNPLMTGSNIEVTIPANFDLSNLTQVRTLGSSLNPNPLWNFDPASSKLTISSFNTVYLPSLDFIYILVSEVRTPAQTGPTASFTYKILDANNKEVEYVSEGIFFTAEAGGLSVSPLVAETYTINADLVHYTFEFQPQDTFTRDAILRLTLPAQLYIDVGPVVSETTGAMSTQATTRVLFNRIVYISNAFPSGNPQGEAFGFKLSGFKNPLSVSETDSFKVSIFYEEDIDVVSNYFGRELTFKATPSNAIDLAVELQETKTGEHQTRMVITGSTVGMDTVIEKQSILEIFIPKEFTIDDFQRTASTCTIIRGFSDEISCEFDKSYDNRFGYYLYVRGGFDSKNFLGGSFSFFLSEVKNPFTTQQTSSFGLKVLDQNEAESYIFEGSVKVQVNQSPFAFAYVESSSPVNGESAFMTFTLTLGVDTPQGAWLEINLPKQLYFDDDRDFYCRGILGLQEELSCYKRGGRVPQLIILGDDLNTQILSNGTTIQFQIGYIKNPLDLRPTDSFVVSSFLKSTSLTTYYYINQNRNGISVRNSESGSIVIDKITQQNTELSEETGLKLEFKTQNKIPQGSELILTLDSILQFDEANTQIKLNGQTVAAQINSVAFQYKIIVPENEVQNFEIEFVSGLRNPLTGPYSLQYFQIEFQTSSPAYSIDKIVSDEKKWVEVECQNNCKQCSGSLLTCISCSYDQTLDKSFYLEDGKCVQSCQAGFYEGSAYECLPCAYPCLECKLASDLCTLCDPNFSKPFADPVTLGCYSECPEGTYLDAQRRQCMKCEEPCYTCKSATECLSCDRTDPTFTQIFFFDKQFKCFEECPDVSIATPGKDCIACESPCKTCEKMTDQCTSCEEGLLLHQSTCVSLCPFLYVANSETNQCDYIGEMQLPIPFSIAALVITVGIGISHFLKGTDRDGREQEGTAFFVTMLALIDILLRINWAILAYNTYREEYKLISIFLLGLLSICILVNILLWRRFFYAKYRFEEMDDNFSIYVKKYPSTASFIIFLSYMVSFQAIRLSYSRILGKKKFMARFSKKRRYFRLIGRLTVLEIFLIYTPAILINVFSIYTIQNSEQIYYLNIDSLVLVSYAVILIVVVLTQRERLLSTHSYFNFSELFVFATEDDQEQEDEIDFDSPVKNKAALNKIMATELDDNFGEQELEMNSAMGYEDATKQTMYQLEKRYGSHGVIKSKGPVKPSDIATLSGKKLSQMDYNEYRQLEDQKDRVQLKQTLYQRKKNLDQSEIAALEEDLDHEQKQKEYLNSQLKTLTSELAKLKKDIVLVNQRRESEVRELEQRKRRETIRRLGKDVPYASHSGTVTGQRSRSAKSQNKVEIRQKQSIKETRSVADLEKKPRRKSTNKAKKGARRSQSPGGKSRSKSPRNLKRTKSPKANNSPKQRKRSRSPRSKYLQTKNLVRDPVVRTYDDWNHEDSAGMPKQNDSPMEAGKVDTEPDIFHQYLNQVQGAKPVVVNADESSQPVATDVRETTLTVENNHGFNSRGGATNDPATRKYHH